VRLALAYAAGARAVVTRDARMFFSYRMRFLGQIVAAFFSVVLFYYISRLVQVSAFRDHDEYFAFAVVGLVTLQVLISSFTSLPGRVRQELLVGTFERLVLSPLGAVAAIAGMAVFPFSLAVFQGIVTIAFAAIVFGMPLIWSTAWLCLPIAVLSLFAFAPFGFVVSGLVLLVKQADSSVGFVTTGLSLVGGFLFPIALLPAWIRWTSEVQPFTPALELLRHFLAGTPLTSSEWVELGKIVGFGAVLYPLSLFFLGWAIRLSQRRGTVIEY
jgi:ABC-2 type transport system permease protein